MATYIIVAEDKDPLGPNEINAGDTIQVVDGDVFIIDPTADAKIKFESDTGASTDFEVRFDQSNANNLKVEFEEDLNPTINISDGVDLSDISIEAKDADSVVLNAGDNVTLERYDGSKNGVDTFTAGDNFTMFKDLDTEGGDDVIKIGANATLKKIDGGKGNDTLITQTDPDTLNIKNIDEDTEEVRFVCFTTGTLIGTAVGQIAIENLTAGDMVTTLDHGEQPIRWIGSRTVGQTELTANPALRPVRIAAGALGIGVPARDLVVSPQHRVLARSIIVERMFNTSEVLVPANKLIGMDGITVDETTTEVTYFHILFDRHEIVFSEGAPTESLYLGPQALAALSAEAIEEIEYLFPDLTGGDCGPELVRPIPAKGRQIKTLAKRHLKNQITLI